MEINRRQLLHGALYTGGGLTAMALLPEPAEAQLFKQASAEQQIQIGRKAAQEILAKEREVKDGRADMFRNMGAKLVAALPASERRKWEFSFRVLGNDTPNAFALPGGPMFMYTGLFKRLGTEDALAAVTGHEMAHVYKEHWAKAARKQQERQAGLVAGLLILGKGRVNNNAQTLAGLVDSVFTTKFSRSEEDESDKLGLRNLVEAGYNPEGMVQLFTVLQKISGNGGNGRLGDFLSSHPMTSDRIKNAQKRIAEYEGRRNFPALRPLNYNTLAAR